MLCTPHRSEVVGALHLEARTTPKRKKRGDANVYYYLQLVFGRSDSKRTTINNPVVAHFSIENCVHGDTQKAIFANSTHSERRALRPLVKCGMQGAEIIL